MMEYYELDRELYQDVFIEFLESMGFSNYGYYEYNRDLGKDFDDEINKKWINSDGDFENDVFSVTSYCWCDVDGGCQRCHKPNFHYKPTDFRLSWYKYPLRGNSCNKKITSDEFLKIINHCRRSFYE
jgi:hypothetical protein